MISFWEHNSFTQYDIIIVGAGITGLSTACSIKEKQPDKNILVLERGIFPTGASTKNAGFACFGSMSEILDDLNHHTEDEVLALIQQRVEGLRQLRALLGDTTLDYQAHGGYELFLKQDKQTFNHCRDKMAYVNALIAEILQGETFQLKELNRRLTQEIRQRKRIEKNLVAVEQTLEQHSKLAALGEMSAAISHELNQPLAAMKTYLAGASLLLKRNRPDETVAALMRIDDLIQRMGGITKQLKSFSRKNTEGFEPLDFKDAFASAIAIMEPQINQTNVNIETSITTQSIIIMGDQQRLEQVIINLLRNALDAVILVKHPEIKISLKKDKTAIFSIRDNGCGISNLKTLFEPFQTTKESGKGLGLGLTISSNIISELGGTLQAENLSSNGAEFRIILPLFDPSKITVTGNKEVNSGAEL